MAVSKRLRYEILRRDSNTCRYCGQSAPDVKLTVDHVVPTALGGSWSVWTVNGQPVPRDPNWKNSILRFLAGGLDDQFMGDAIHTAMGLDRVPASEKWRYFCGICWREIDHILGRTAAVVEEEPRPEKPVVTTAPRGSYPFPYMLLFEDFVRSLVDHVGGNDIARQQVNDALWHAFPLVYDVYMKQLEWGSDDSEALAVASQTLLDETGWFIGCAAKNCRTAVSVDGQE